MKNKRGFWGCSSIAMLQSTCCRVALVYKKRYLSNQLIESFWPWLTHISWKYWQMSFGLNCFMTGKWPCAFDNCMLFARADCIGSLYIRLRLVIIKEMLWLNSLLVCFCNDDSFPWTTRNICPCTLCIECVSPTHLDFSNKDGEGLMLHDFIESWACELFVAMNSNCVDGMINIDVDFRSALESCLIDGHALTVHLVYQG